MKSTFSYILTAVLLAVICFSTVQADRVNKYRQAYLDEAGNTHYCVRDGLTTVVDTIFAGVYDTVTVHKKANSDGCVVFFKCNVIAGASDTIQAFYRPVPVASWTGATTGSSLIPLLIRSASGDSAYVVDWTDGAMYWVEEFDPVYAQLQQFFFIGGTGDTIRITAVIEQIVKQEE